MAGPAPNVVADPPVHFSAPATDVRLSINDALANTLIDVHLSTIATDASADPSYNVLVPASTGHTRAFFSLYNSWSFRIFKGYPSAIISIGL